MLAERYSLIGGRVRRSVIASPSRFLLSGDRQSAAVHEDDRRDGARRRPSLYLSTLKPAGTSAQPIVRTILKRALPDIIRA
jgi:hypothetical protein